MEIDLLHELRQPKRNCVLSLCQTQMFFQFVAGTGIGS
jgi:hypothetical protein